jgi:hypothetical protein
LWLLQLVCPYNENMGAPKAKIDRATRFLEELHDIQQQALRDRLAAEIKAKLAVKAAARNAAAAISAPDS